MKCHVGKLLCDPRSYVARHEGLILPFEVIGEAVIKYRLTTNGGLDSQDLINEAIIIDEIKPKTNGVPLTRELPVLCGYSKNSCLIKSSDVGTMSMPPLSETFEARYSYVKNRLARNVVYVATNLIQGEDLSKIIPNLSKIMSKTMPAGSLLSEPTAKALFKQICEVVYKVHERHISHTDLKLENIIIGSAANITLIDFAFSKKILTSPGTFNCGTPGYAPHEVYAHQVPYTNQLYNLEVRNPYAIDMFSLGSILFCLNIPCFPFKDALETDPWYSTIFLYDYLTFWNAWRFCVEDKCRLAVYLNESLMDLINNLLCHEPELRLSFSELMEHPWLKSLKEIDSGEYRRDIAERFINYFNWVESIKHHFDK